MNLAQAILDAEFQTRIYRYKRAPRVDPMWEVMCRQANLRCWICRKQFPFRLLTRDHIIPLSKRGPRGLRNVRPACGRCNQLRGNKPAELFEGV